MADQIPIDQEGFVLDPSGGGYLDRGDGYALNIEDLEEDEDFDLEDYDVVVAEASEAPAENDEYADWEDAMASSIHDLEDRIGRELTRAERNKVVDRSDMSGEPDAIATYQREFGIDDLKGDARLDSQDGRREFMSERLKESAQAAEEGEAA